MTYGLFCRVISCITDKSSVSFLFRNIDYIRSQSVKELDFVIKITPSHVWHWEQHLRTFTERPNYLFAFKPMHFLKHYLSSHSFIHSFSALIFWLRASTEKDGEIQVKKEIFHLLGTSLNSQMWDMPKPLSHEPVHSFLRCNSKKLDWKLTS